MLAEANVTADARAARAQAATYIYAVRAIAGARALTGKAYEVSTVVAGIGGTFYNLRAAWQ